MKDYSKEYIVPNFKMTKDLIVMAIGDEVKANWIYTGLSSISDCLHEKQQLLSIANDEKKHEQLLNDIYRMLFHSEPNVNGLKPDRIENYLNGLKMALMDETMAIAPYRMILRGLPNMRVYQDMMYEIITDEQKHADKLSYIIMENMR